MPKPLKTSAEVAVEITAPPAPILSAVELTSADILLQVEAKAAALQAQAVESAAAAIEFRRTVAYAHGQCAADMNRLARAILERKWFRAEAALVVTADDETELASLLLKHHDERQSYDLAPTRSGDPFRVEPPRERTFELYGSRAGEKTWLLLVDLATRPLRAKAAAARVALLEVEIVALVASILASRAANGFNLAEIAVHASVMALPAAGEARPVTPAEILRELEVAR